MSRDNSIGDGVPARNSLTNLPVADLCTSCKRIHRGEEASRHDGSFIIQPLAGGSKSFRAEPKLLLSRTQLPLSYIAPFANVGVPQLPRFCTARISSFKGCESLRCLAHRNSLIVVVSLERLDGFFALERVQDSIYSLSALDSALTLEFLRNLLRHGSGEEIQVPPVDMSINSTRSNRVEWWSTACLNNLSHDRPCKRRRTDEDRNLEDGARAVGTTSNTITERVSEVTLPIYDVSAPNGTIDEGTDHASVSPSLEEVVPTIVNQYLDALYLSKTSLAYFPKGPLSRARALFGTKNGAQSLQALSVSLRSMILGSLMDKKYKETLCECLEGANLSAQVDTERGTTLRGKAAKKKKKSRKAKLGKDGLYPEEENFLKKWWSEHELGQNVIASTGRDGFLKRRLAELRFRESLLQMILSLEVLAIEAIAANNEAVPETESQGNTHVSAVNASDLPKAGKQRKPKDVRAGLDVLVDWLCIWHSINASDHSSEVQDSEDKPGHGAVTSGSCYIDSTEGLKTFCTEVIIPFYSSRLPDVTKDLCAKLGAPFAISPTRQKLSKHSTLKRKVAPGVEVHRDGHTKSNRSSRRTSRDLSAATSRPFSRSSTDSMLQRIKREETSTPQAPLSLADSGRTLSRSNSISHAKKFNQREVDMSSMMNPKGSRLKEKGSIAEEMKNAIAVLKKPNRGQAVKEYYDAAERVAPTRQNMAKRATIAREKRTGVAVQVNATPKREEKTRDAMKATPQQDLQHDQPNNATSSGAYISSSAMRSESQQMNQGHEASFDNYNDRHRHKKNIAQTPCKTLIGQTPASTLLVPNSSLRPHPRWQETTSENNGTSPLNSSPGAENKRRVGKQVLLTPSAKAKARNSLSSSIVTTTPLSSSRLGNVDASQKMSRSDGEVEETPSKSLYQALGWDDDDLDELT